MAFSITIPGIAYKQPVVWQNLDDLGENDAFIKAMLSAPRRPVLQWISVTQVDVENNTGTSNQTSILFSDGTIRSVTEDTSSTNKYRRFDITATAQFTSGTEDSGLRSGLTEATNTWYAVYAVKSQINVSNFVLVGDTTLPLQANVATLNSRYGTDSWVYLGMIRNGDNQSATGDLLSFYQAGGYTRFNNGCNAGVGTKLAGSSTPITYTTTNGTGTTDIPDHLKIVEFMSAIDDRIYMSAFDATAARQYLSCPVTSLGGGSTTPGYYWTAPASEGFQVQLSSGSGNVQLAGFYDSVLGIGVNPLI